MGFLRLLLLIISGYGFAEGITDEQKRYAAELDEEIGGLPVFFRTPETGFALGAVLIYVPKNDLLKPEPLITGLMYTEKEQFLWALGTKKKLASSDVTAKIYFEIIDFPQKYFGSGAHTLEADEQLISERRVLFEPGLEYPIWSHLSVGLSLVFRKDQFKSVERKKSTINYSQIAGIEGGEQRGCSLYLFWEDIDDVFYPKNGSRLSGGWSDYLEELGASYPFHVWYLDGKLYKSLSPNLVWANRIYGSFQSGHVPYYQLEKLGGHDLLRGYFAGRYRDRNIFVAETEMRYRFHPRFVAAAFTGAGDVAHDPQNFTVAELRPSYGVGLRYQITETQKINLRADIGIGNEGPQLYLYVLEAF